jgi:hypothetical protein
MLPGVEDLTARLVTLVPSCPEVWPPLSVPPVIEYV